MVRARHYVVAGLSAAIVAAIAACGHSNSPSNPYVTGMQALPNIPTTKTTSSVVLPSGSTVNPTQLTVLSMVDQTVPASNGQFTLSSSDNGSQIAIVLSPRGNPMLLGWIDDNHANISASTTAEVLVYFGLAGYLIDEGANRETLIQEIPSAAGFQALVSAISAELAANPETFAVSNATVAAALTGVVGPLLAGASVSTTEPVAAPADEEKTFTRARLRALLTPQSVTVQDGTKSGLDVQPDNPFSAHVVNNTRRRTWAFVSEVSFTVDGVTHPFASDLTNFEVGPEVGLNNGFAGTISDLINYAYGNTSAAYEPVSAPDPPFTMALQTGSSATNYQVTIVGPGIGATAALTSLPLAQATQLTATATKGFLVDALLPFFVNAVMGAKSAQSPDLATTDQAFYSNLATNLTTDAANLLAASPGLNDKVLAGDQLGAISDFLTNVVNSNTYQQFVESIAAGVTVSLAAVSTPGAVAAQTQKGLLTALAKFNQALAAAGVTLQVYDTLVLVNAVLQANAVENWNLTVSPAVVTINPLTSTVYLGGSVKLTAALPGVSDLSAYSFLWTTTGLAGTLTGANASQSNVTSYCTSSPSTTYQASANPAFPSGATSLQDTVSVQVFQATGSGACTTGMLIAATTGVGSSLPATIVVDKNLVSITPENPVVAPGQVVSFTASTGFVSSDGSQPSYQWSLQGNGSISATTGATISYTAGSTGPDTLSVTATDPEGSALGKGAVTITVKPPSGLTFTASSGSACCGGIDPGTYTTTVVPTGTYGYFCANYQCGQQYGFIVSWPISEGINPTLNLALNTGATITAPATWNAWDSILDTLVPGQFLFISSSSDNQGYVTIGTLTPLPMGQQLATFTFHEGSTSSQSTRTYDGSGSFIIPAPPPATN